MEHNTQMLELLEKIEKTNRRQLLFIQVLCGLALAVAIFCIIALVQIYQLLPDLEGVITQMQSVLGDMQLAAGQLAQLDIQGIVTDIGSLVQDVGDLTTVAQDSLKQTMTKLDAINFATLNKAIEDLAAVIEPLAKFFKPFG